MPAAADEVGEQDDVESAPVDAAHEQGDARIGVEADCRDRDDGDGHHHKRLRKSVAPVPAGVVALERHPVHRLPVGTADEPLHDGFHEDGREAGPHSADFPEFPVGATLACPAIVEGAVQYEQPELGRDDQRDHVQGEVAAACGEGCETQQRAEKSDQVDGNGEAREIEEEKLEELKPLSEVKAVEVAPNDEAGRVERPGAALLVEVGYVVRRVLRHSAHDRQIKATPAAPKR